MNEHDDVLNGEFNLAQIWYVYYGPPNLLILLNVVFFCKVQKWILIHYNVRSKFIISILVSELYNGGNC